MIRAVLICLVAVVHRRFLGTWCLDVGTQLPKVGRKFCRSSRILATLEFKVDDGKSHRTESELILRRMPAAFDAISPTLAPVFLRKGFSRHRRFESPLLRHSVFSSEIPGNVPRKSAHIGPDLHFSWHQRQANSSHTARIPAFCLRFEFHWGREETTPFD